MLEPIASQRLLRAVAKKQYTYFRFPYHVLDQSGPARTLWAKASTARLDRPYLRDLHDDPHSPETIEDHESVRGGCTVQNICADTALSPEARAGVGE